VGAHRGLWSFTGIHYFIKIPVVAFTGGVGSYVLIHQILAWTNYPRSMYILTAVFLFVLMSVNRGGVRLFRQWFQGLGQHGTPVVIVGAGRAGEMLVRDMRHNAHYTYNPVAFIDPDPSKQGSTIHGIRVAGDYRAFADVIAKGGPAVMTLPGMIASPGGLPIVSDGKIIGAVGVSGVTGDQDEQCAKAGISSM